MEPDMVHKALGNEVRQRILLILSKRDSYLSEIAGKIGLAPQTADFHLNLLADIGVVTYEWKDGKKYYHLKDRKILEYLRERKPLPPHMHPHPPHEIVMDAMVELNKRLDRIEGKLDRLLKEKEEEK